jgi:ATP-dependent Clp protease ATP-binding subunit ClpC
MTKEAKALLVREGYSPAYGARPLRRTIQRLVETPLSRALLKNEYQAGDTVEVRLSDDQQTLVFERVGVLLTLETKHTTETLTEKV